MLVFASCSGWEYRLADDRSVAAGTDFVWGFTVPDGPPGRPLTDARPGEKLVLWSPDGFEAILEVGAASEVLVRDGDGARPANDEEIARLARLFTGWMLVPSTRAERYAEELGRATPGTSGAIFPSHLRAMFDRLDASEAMRLAIENRPDGWMRRGGRAVVLERAASRCAPADLNRVARQASGEPFSRDAADLWRACLARRDLPQEALKHLLMGLAERGDLEEAGDLRALAFAHPAAGEDALLLGTELLGREELSSERRAGIEAIAASPAATAQVLRRLAEVPLFYDDDFAAAIRSIAAHPAASAEVHKKLRAMAEKIRDPQVRAQVVESLH